MNRGDLKQQVASYAKGGAAGSRLPLDTIFDNAQRRIIRTVHPVDLDVWYEPDTSAAVQFQGQVYSHQLPSDLLDPFYVTNNNTRLRSYRADYLVQNYAQGDRTLAGENKPYFYAFSGPRTILTAPGPGAVLRIGYMSADELTPEDTQENVVMREYPDVYFWAMMMGVEAFYRSGDGYGLANSEFGAIVKEINQVAAETRFGAGGTAASW